MCGLVEEFGCWNEKEVLNVTMGKAAKSLILEVLKEANGALEDESWLFNAGMEQSLRFNHTKSLQRTISTFSADVESGLAMAPASLSGILTSLANVYHGLFVLKDISTMLLSCQHNEYGVEKIFFSALSFISTITDCILRKLRGLLMVVSLDCTKLELFVEGNFKPSLKISNEKPSAGGRKKKGRAHSMKRLKSVLDEPSFDKTCKDLKVALGDTKKVDLIEADKMPGIPHGKDIHREISTSEMEIVVCHQEHAQGAVAGKGRSNARKTRKEKNKIRNCSLNNLIAVKDSKILVTEITSSIIMQDEVAKYDNMSVRNVSADNSTSGNILAANLSSCSSTSMRATEGIASQSTQEGLVVDSMSLECLQFSNCGIDYANKCFTQETMENKVECNTMPARDLDNTFSNGNVNFQKSFDENRTEAKSVLRDKGIETFEVKTECAVIQDQRNENFYGMMLKSSLGPSYEWPTIATFYFPSINSHLLPAADRLHLDVGQNWHSYIRQPFVPTVHQARNPPIEGGCNQILSQPLPMSVDWSPMVRRVSGIAPSVTCNYDSGFISARQSGFQQSFALKGIQFNANITDDEGKYSGDFIDLPDLTTAQEPGDECDSPWISEEEFEVHKTSDIHICVI